MSLSSENASTVGSENVVGNVKSQVNSTKIRRLKITTHMKTLWIELKIMLNLWICVNNISSFVKKQTSKELPTKFYTFHWRMWIEGKRVERGKSDGVQISKDLWYHFFKCQCTKCHQNLSLNYPQHPPKDLNYKRLVITTYLMLPLLVTCPTGIHTWHIYNDSTDIYSAQSVKNHIHLINLIKNFPG